MPLTGRRILIAEDEGLIALQLEDLMTSLGCEVIGPVPRVSDVLEFLDRHTLDGALLDVNLRGQPVFPALPRLDRLGVPYIITSGYDAASLFPPEYRSAHRVTKPFDEDELKRLCVALFAAK